MTNYPLKIEMYSNKFVFLISFITSVKSYQNVRQGELRKFPDGFLFGTATASYQVEGAWNVSDKGENIWDKMTHNEPWRIEDGQNGDIADDSYHLYQRDVQMLRELGVDFYRFSISWSRILPTGFTNQISQDGVDYYNRLINELLKYGITPMITIYHWDLPQALQDLGGWTNPLIEEWFSDFARVAFEIFGDRVKLWATINEPYQICYQGYGTTVKAPVVNAEGIGEYLCAKNVVKSHARAWHIYDEEFRNFQNGRIGIVVSTLWYEPASDSDDDIEAAEDMLQFYFGLYTNPIFSMNGDFPAAVKKRIAKRSEEQGYAISRLPEFTEEEVEYIKGTSDYFGLNHYTTNMAYRNESLLGAYNQPSYLDDQYTGTFHDPSWPESASVWLKVVPWGLRKMLKYVSELYNYPEILITENGFSTSGGLEDDNRVSYFRSYLDAVLDAIYEDGCDVRAYTAWSLMDNFEWMYGYTNRFGLYEVDYESPERTRTPRKSALVYKEIIRSREIDLDYVPHSMDITID